MNIEMKHNSVQAAEVDEAAVRDVVASCGLTALTARVLVARDVTTPQQVRDFLSPSLDRDWYDPSLIPGLIEVADIVEESIRENEKIVIFGDFDVDGITATTIGVRGLRELGANVDGLIPHRYEEGYALSEKAIERAMTLDPDLIVTVDCGISCHEEVLEVQRRGVKVVITDHHEPGEHVPTSTIVADPKLERDCPSRDLAGAGVALKLLQVLGKRFDKPDLWRQFTDFASLGTIADLMPLKGENRALVADGISKINNRPRTCFLALCAACNVQPEEITSTKLSFSFIPRMNAAGRMGDATLAFDLLMSDDREEAEVLASKLDSVNTQRREVEAELVKQVEAELSASYDDGAAIVIGGEGWHEGVKGIVASRIARAYKRPTLIFSIEGGIARGSGRTYDDLNLFELVGRQSDLFEAFGGHAAAVGVTISADRLDQFRNQLCVDVAQETARAGQKPRYVDAVVDLDECTVEAFWELEYLQPFGNENRMPVLAAKNVFLENRGAVGKAGNHFRYHASDGVVQAAGIYFNVEDIDSLVSCESVCDVVFEPSVDEWQGRHTAKLMTRDIMVHDEVLETPQEVEKFVDELFAREGEILDSSLYAGIGNAASFHTKVAGVTFENRQPALRGLESGDELCLVREPDNPVDPNAIAVAKPDGTQLGFLNKDLAERLSPLIDEGTVFEARVSELTGGPMMTESDNEQKNYGLNILVSRPDLAGSGDDNGRDLLEQERKRVRDSWASIESEELDDRIREALIGDNGLHDAQSSALAHLASGESTLAIMATGRGKSLIFHLHAARCALKKNKASVFVYPLRALVADQYFHLVSTFERFGLSVRVLTGEVENEERAEIFDAVKAGTVDVLLTTPEFLTIHAGRFADTERIGFVVVDEAHHVGQAKAGNRMAYTELTGALATMGNPQVLAVTATAGDAQAQSICKVLGIEEIVLDPTVRSNLHIDDRRDLRNKESYLASMVARGEKCVIYVNSREQTIQLTRMLRKRVPALAPRVAFYNAGLSKTDRKRIEDAFRSSDLQVIVSTSAFGEGIDIPDIQHVVLYHLPFSDIEFNQMAGRAGRDGRDAQVHLLYSYGDARINEAILSSSAPSRNQMIALYRALKSHGDVAAEQGEGQFTATNTALADEAAKIDHRVHINESSVSCGIAVFRELGFLQTSGRGVSRAISMVEGPSHMELTDSVRYREGAEQVEDFSAFKKWALGASPEELLSRFNRPILPAHPEDLV